MTPNIIYNRQIYAVYALDDFKVTPRLTLNLGLRYELFTTIKEANNNQATFDFNSLSLIAPSGQNTALTPTLGTELAILNNGSPGLISPDLNNFAPRVGLAYQMSDKLVFRAGYGVFYGGQENGPFSNPSPGFNPPFLSSEAYQHSLYRALRKSYGPQIRLLDLGREQWWLAAQRPVAGLSYQSPASPSATRTHLNFTRSIRIWSRPTRSSGTWASSTNCPPTPFSKFPTPARAD